MKGYTIQHSIELLEKNQGGGSGGSTTAENVSYDNTGSGLTADDVQEAIDELKQDIGAINTGFDIKNTEHVIGKFLNSDLCQNYYHLGDTAVQVGQQNWYSTDISSSDIDQIVFAFGINTIAKACYPLMGTVDTTNNVVQLLACRDGVYAGITDLVLYYVKTTPASNTRSKKSSK